MDLSMLNRLPVLRPCHAHFVLCMVSMIQTLRNIDL